MRNGDSQKGGWIQVFQDEKRAGSSSVTLAVSHRDGQVDDLRDRHIEVLQTSNSDVVNTAIVNDPDGSQIVFAEAIGMTIGFQEPIVMPELHCPSEGRETDLSKLLVLLVSPAAHADAAKNIAVALARDDHSATTGI